VNCSGAAGQWGGARRGEGATASVGTDKGLPSLPAACRTTIFTMPGLLTIEVVTAQGGEEEEEEGRGDVLL